MVDDLAALQVLGAIFSGPQITVMARTLPVKRGWSTGGGLA
jgi:hypothetical protein